MWTKQHKKPKYRIAILPIIALGLLSYFAFHGINGNLGLQSSERYQQKIAKLNDELGVLRAERLDFEKRTKLLSEGSLERDLVDETARLSLGLTRDNELVLLHSSN